MTSHASEPQAQSSQIQAAPSKSPLIEKSLSRASRLERREQKLARIISAWRIRLRKNQNTRLIVAGVFFLGLIVLTIRPELRLEVPWIIVLVTIFTYFVIRTRNIHRHVQGLEHLQSFIKRQKNRNLGRPSERSSDGAIKLATDLPLAPDLGILGSHSLFTLIDETITDFGEAKLLSWISSPLLNPDDIRKRQGAIQSLKKETWFYTRLTLITESEEFRLSTSQILEFLKHPFVSANFNRIFALNLIVWVSVVILVIASMMTGFASPTPFVMAFALLSLWTLNQFGSPFHKGIGLSHHLNLLSPVFEKIEKRCLSNAVLKELLPSIADAGPSREAKRVNRVLNFLGIQANPLLYMVINIFLPWTVTATYFLEKRRQKIATSFPQCLEELAEFEALSSLALMERYQTDVYPEISKTQVMDLHSVFHPLIERAAVVANDFRFPEGKTLGLLTGSNMSGKSTFLRTLGLNQILANMGAPVFAEKFHTHPLEIETCIEVSDSLRDGFSYFYAEVRRLKHLLARAATGAPVLFLIDEIFRGTNNRERQIGSRAVIRTLAKEANALGFVSTHDLELTALEESTPSVMNLHFREEIRGGEMFFTYKLHPGPCPTTNALKIMAAEGIAVET